MKHLLIIIALCWWMPVHAQSGSRSFGWLPDKSGVRDVNVASLPKFTRAIIKAKTDIRATMPPVYDQGMIGSCTGNGVAALLDFAHVKSLPSATFFTPSRLFLYYGGRVAIGAVDEDSGAQIRDVITVALKQGAPKEATWPYRESRYRTKPSATAYTEAMRFQALNAYKCSTLDDVRRALSLGLPVTFGVPVYPAIMDLSWYDYTVPMPTPRERSIGGHCMVIVGHDDARRVLIVRNSWGKTWGRAGHCLLPYDYYLKFERGADAWVISAAE